MNGHTPEPWRLVGEKGEEVIRGPKGHDGYGELIAVMGEHNAIKNARLIVAVPDLLAACKAVLSWATAHDATVTGHREPFPGDVLRTAIAKAEEK